MTTSGSPVAASPMTTLLATITVGYPFLISLGMALGRPRLTVVVVAMVMLDSRRHGLAIGPPR